MLNGAEAAVKYTPRRAAASLRGRAGSPFPRLPYPTASFQDLGSPEAAYWHSPGRACPHTATTHPWVPITMSAVWGHPSTCPLKPFYYSKDFGCNSPLCCAGGRGATPFPGQREPGDAGTALLPVGMLPSPGWREDVWRSVLFVVGSVCFNHHPAFPLSSVFPHPDHSHKGPLTAMVVPPPSPLCPTPRLTLLAAHHLSKLSPLIVQGLFVWDSSCCCFEEILPVWRCFLTCLCCSPQQTSAHSLKSLFFTEIISSLHK